jgi:prepilin-type N-terminal cleavage/methylation domain-containing protein
MAITKTRRTGFTIVELLIVIVIIGILATITIVAYNGMQQRARDAIRRSDLATLKTALHTYNVDKGDYAQVGCGAANLGIGFITTDYDGVGPLLSVTDCLKGGGYIVNTITDPNVVTGDCGGTSITCNRYMKYTCGLNTYLFANLESVPHTSTDTDSTCMVNLDTGYGMNYILQIN